MTIDTNNGCVRPCVGWSRRAPRTRHIRQSCPRAPHDTRCNSQGYGHVLTQYLHWPVSRTTTNLLPSPRRRQPPLRPPTPGTLIVDLETAPPSHIAMAMIVTPVNVWSLLLVLSAHDVRSPVAFLSALSAQTLNTDPYLPPNPYRTSMQQFSLVSYIFFSLLAAS